MTRKFDIIVSDPPWEFNDKLEMENLKRGAQSQYSVLNLDEIKKLPIKKIANDDAVLVLWVPGSFLQNGIDVMEAWGFSQKQVHVWVKHKKSPLTSLIKDFRRTVRQTIYELRSGDVKKSTETLYKFANSIESFNLNNILAFKMGRLFRQTHEIALIGVRGKVYSKLKNKSQRSVHFHEALKHSEKPEDIQDMLEIMFPKTTKLEIFARRSRKDWLCLGNQSPESFGEDIRDSLKKLLTNSEIEEFETEISNSKILQKSSIELIKNIKSITKSQRKYILQRLK